MGGDEHALAADGTRALAEQLAADRQPLFWLALTCAAAVHAALLFGVSRWQPHYLGDPGGRSRAINVELVDAAELRSSASSSEPAGATSALDSPAAAPAASAPSPKPSPAPDAAAASEPALAAKLSALLPPETEEPQPSSPEKAAPKTAQPKAAAKTQAASKPAAKPALTPPEQLDLSVPGNMTMLSSKGGASSATRPPGITRSGENDRFGRGVIRALKKTMPPPHGLKGRVTIRILLDEKGNIAKVQLLQSGGDPTLDQEVVFSAHQASFPFPPKDATVADRTFRVTYVYR